MLTHMIKPQPFHLNMHTRTFISTNMSPSYTACMHFAVAGSASRNCRVRRSSKLTHTQRRKVTRLSPLLELLLGNTLGCSAPSTAVIRKSMQE